MTNLKEIVTKAVISKTKKTTTQKYSLNIDTEISKVLGCWIINHDYAGYNKEGKVNVQGTYDINIWYSYDNNTKTNVIANKFSYDELLGIHLKNNEKLTPENEIIVRTLTNPSVTNVDFNGNTINLEVTKELGVEIIGPTKIRVNVLDDYDDYDEELDTNIELNDDYLTDK